MVSVRNKNNLLDMYKIYPEEAVMLPLCPDPLCKHNSESCPFYNINPTMYTIGDTVYYLRKSGGSKLENTICSYDFGTDKFKVLHEVEKGYYIMCFRPYEKYIFF